MTQLLPPGSAGLPDWEERLQEAAYSGPSGARITFAYENVSRNFKIRGKQFDFPGVSDSFIQQTGHGSRRYPMRCFFNGAQHDLIATAFEAILLEVGLGSLEHPLYGTFPVVPFGEITRRGDLKTAANQTVIEVTFWTTVGAVYPLAQQDAQSEIEAALALLDAAMASQFADSTSLAGALDQSAMKSGVRSFLKGISKSLDSISRTVGTVNRAFRSIQREINFGLDVLVGQPLQLAQQISNLIKAPARAIAGIRSRLAAYRALFDDIFGSKAGNPIEALAAGVGLGERTQRIGNDFHLADLHAVSTVAGSIVVVTQEPFDVDGNVVRGPLFRTKPDVLEAAELVLQLFDDVADWREEAINDLATVPGVNAFHIDPGNSYQQMQSAVALTIGFLVQLSFDLTPERRIVLDRPRTLVDLAAQLYGSVDDRLDFLISSNNLSGSEILELPTGKTIVYYP